MSRESFHPDADAIIRSMTLSERFDLGRLLNQRARRRYREKLQRELPEWSEQERDRLLRAATLFGTIDTAESWQDVYSSPEFQERLAAAHGGKLRVL
jgi:hypothetical protein